MEQIFETHIPLGEMGVRMALAALFGVIIGIDRELQGREAGLRTNMLIALAASVFTILTLELAAEITERSDESRPDPLRIFEAITAGVAFLAAGTIIRFGSDVRGLTTAAAMWLVGSIGIACGMGAYSVAGIATILGFIIITLIGYFERRYIERKTPDQEVERDSPDQA